MTKLRPSEPFVYQLRRIGPPASVENVCDVMRLKIGTTKFGRSQTNDFYLDSAHLRNFISRRHAEVVGEIENGEIKFVFHDMGLNGTFVNDVRMDGKHLLEEGDKITFGHTNGYKIKPGQYAAQSSSEFQFVFEKVPCSDTNSERLYNSECDEEAEEGEEEEEEDDKEKSKDINDINSTKINSRNVVNNVNKKCKDKVASIASKDEVKNNADIISDNEDSDDDNKNENGDTSNMNFSGKESEQIGEDKSQNRTNQISSLLSETLPAVDNDRSSSPFVPNQSSVTKAKQTNTKSASCNSKAKSKASDHFSFSDDSSSDDQKKAMKPKSSATNVKRKRRGPGPSDGKKRKRTKKNDTDTSDEELPDGVEWCEEEYCEADECKKPKGKKVQWVQCDDCDKWYHTVCVGTSYEKVKDTDIHFNCGFCE